ncbi:ABC transporter permease [Rhodococcus pseudokoreensis]|uniref:ABC transporter permease n=1 Tax=Rhodococcus pseudokoreensis TaxID=2811421 RepID=A0A974ZW76_9NOCA|nr:ABC transporter permease [Rhodococcus pseudokoreensis]QSE92202.1 ABC transporter permease [Rhodococcus pseudokoreensis]
MSELVDRDVTAPAVPPSEGPADLLPGLVPETAADRDPRRSTESLWRSVTHGRGLAGAILVGIVVLLGALAPVLAPFAPDEQLDASFLLGPSSAHWLGTDDVNRDVLSRVLFGIRADLLIVFVAVPVGAILGSVIGLIAGTRGYTDVLAQRVFDVILAFPALVLAIALTAVLGPGVQAVVLVIVLAEIPVFGRLIRTSVLKVRELPYVEAAVVSGASTGWILRRHVLPNSVEPLGVQLALSMSIAVFIEGAMSFLGIGVVPPTPSLGSILSDGNRYLETNPLFAVGPLVVVSLLTLGFLLISQAFAHARRL